MINSLKRWWIFLSGFDNESSMENRMFNAVSLTCLVLLVLLTGANFNLGYNTIALWTSLTIPLLAVIYYLARFANRFLLASYLFTTFSYVLMIGLFLLNSGMSGPSIYGFLLTFLIIILITPTKTHLLWFTLHTTIVIGLFLAEAAYPNLVVYQYDNIYAQVLDNSITYVPVLLFIYVSGIFLRKSYNSEKKLADERLTAINAQKHELEFTNKEKDRLFSIIGHDLRSPLYSIQGYLEVLNSTTISNEDRSEIQHQLYDLTSNTSQLLNNLLLWSSKSGNDLKLNPVNLKETVTEVIDLIQPQAFKKNVQISCTSLSDKVFVEADKDMLQLVIRNLLSNAVKFTPPKGNVNVWCEPKDNTVNIFVKDTGAGIPESKKKDIFTSRAKPTQGTAQESGIGLGLVLCQEFVTNMNGSISFESTENVGSTFAVTLNKG